MKSNGKLYRITAINKGAKNSFKSNYDAKSSLQAVQRQRKTTMGIAKAIKVQKLY
jgi:hypothetical protein